MTWDTESNNQVVSRADAQVKIREMALDQGINGVFKVFYDGVLVTSPDTLPEQVDLTLVRVSEVLDQAVS